MKNTKHDKDFIKGERKLRHPKRHHISDKRAKALGLAAIPPPKAREITKRLGMKHG